MVAVRRRFSAETVERHQTFRRRSMNKDLGEKFSGARENAANALDASREQASELGDEVRMRGTKIIQANALASLAGRLALGVMLAALDRKRVVMGKRVLVRVGLGGRRNNKKKK